MPHLDLVRGGARFHQIMDSELISPFRVGVRYAACIPDTSTHKTASTNLFGLPPSDFNCLNVEKQWFLLTNPLLHNISELKHGGCSAKKMVRAESITTP